jgi:hypothetical protein
MKKAAVAMAMLALAHAASAAEQDKALLARAEKA